MNVLLCFANLFKPRNWLMLFALLFNMALCVVVGNFILVYQGGVSQDYILYISLGIVGAYLLVEILLMTPLGEWFLRLQLGIGVLRRDEYSEEIYQVFDNLVEKARKHNKYLSKKIKLYLQDSNEINAFAFCSRTVCITRGLAELPINQISGVLAHEFGHINYYDSYVSTLTLHGNALFVVLLRIASIPFYFVALFFDFLIKILTKAEKCNLCRSVISIILKVIITVANIITSVCFYIRSRIVEYRADAYTALIGEKNNLSEALQTLLNTYGEPKFNLLDVVFSSHPKTSQRIEKLKLIPNQEV